jgi:hypothetical protein
MLMKQNYIDELGLTRRVLCSFAVVAGDFSRLM